MFDSFKACQDILANECPRRAHYCKVPAYSRLIQKYCRKTCGFCKSANNETAENVPSLSEPSGKWESESTDGNTDSFNFETTTSLNNENTEEYTRQFGNSSSLLKSTPSAPVYQTTNGNWNHPNGTSTPSTRGGRRHGNKKPRRRNPPRKNGGRRRNPNRRH